jgi:hypothetical protein
VKWVLNNGSYTISYPHEKRDAGNYQERSNKPIKPLQTYQVELSTIADRWFGVLCLVVETDRSVSLQHQNEATVEMTITTRLDRPNRVLVLVVRWDGASLKAVQLKFYVSNAGELKLKKSFCGLKQGMESSVFQAWPVSSFFLERLSLLDLWSAMSSFDLAT